MKKKIIKKQFLCNLLNRKKKILAGLKRRVEGGDKPFLKNTKLSITTEA